MSGQHSKLWSKKVGEEVSDDMGWGTRKNTFDSLDDLPVETFHIKQTKKLWQDQSPSKKSGSRRVPRREVATEGQTSKQRKKVLTKSTFDDVLPANPQQVEWEGSSNTWQPKTPERSGGVSEEVIEDYLQDFQEGRVGFYHIGTFLFIVQDWSIEDCAPMVSEHYTESNKQVLTVKNLSWNGIISMRRRSEQQWTWNVGVQMVGGGNPVCIRNVIWNLGRKGFDGWKTTLRLTKKMSSFSSVGNK
ncbi:hypothetical protein PM082_023258 [Marasmius tenuissimus]|nr:hypothetical protein PM082_023258 [Marasmius tenuissimus]